MTKGKIPNELLKLVTEEEIMMFRELQIKIQELNYKTNLTRLIEGDDYWQSILIKLNIFNYREEETT